MLAVSPNNKNAWIKSLFSRQFGNDIANDGRAAFDNRIEQLPSPKSATPMDESDSFNADEILGELDVDSVVETVILNGDGEQPFFVCDVGVVVKQFDKWKELLPRVEPFYAVKCNNDQAILTALQNLGTGFDCASQAEIATMLDMGVDPSRIVYANPCKPASHIRFARDKGVHRMTFDNLNELVKIKREFPEAQCVLRIATDDSKSVCQFSVKFGAAISSVESLLQAAKSMELNVIGVSFHVGSGCMDAAQYDAALKSARFVFDKAREIGFGDEFHLLDIGGGFPGVEAKISLEQIATVIDKALDSYFPSFEFPNLRVIAEPGRYFATAAFTLAVSITSRREVMGKDYESTKFMYYVNDGVYGSFNCILFDHVAFSCPDTITRNGRFLTCESFLGGGEKLYSSSVWGPTCDSIDCISNDMKLPELDVGDWLVFKNMGAYTASAATTFNGFPRTKVLYINQDAWWRDRCYSPRQSLSELDFVVEQ